MPSKGRSARKGKALRSLPPDPTRDRVRAQLLEQKGKNWRTETDTLLEQIAECPDAIKASKLIIDALHARGGEVVLPSAGWILPPS